MKRLMEKRTLAHPFYRDEATGRYRVDEATADRDEFQALWQALYEHYQEGGRAQLPWESFPASRLPSEVVAQIVGDDPQIFFHLLATEKAMREPLRHLAPLIIRARYPKYFMYMLVAIDDVLLEKIDEVNALLAKRKRPRFDRAVLLGLMGVTTHFHNHWYGHTPFAEEARRALSNLDFHALEKRWVPEYAFSYAPTLAKERCTLERVRSIRVYAACLVIALRNDITLNGVAFEHWRPKSAADVLVCARALIAALHANTEAMETFTFGNVPAFDTATGFSEEAAELQAVLNDHERDVAFWSQALGTGAPCTSTRISWKRPSPTSVTWRARSAASSTGSTRCVNYGRCMIATRPLRCVVGTATQ